MNPVSLDPGTELGDFRIEARLGAGGTGVVYRARQTSLNRVVALKVIDGGRTSPTELERFRRAAQAAARLQHPNIVATHAVGEAGGLCYLAMEYIDGASLNQAVPHLAAAPIETRLRWPALGADPGGGLVFRIDPTVLGRPGPARPEAELPVLDLVTLAIDGPPVTASPTAPSPAGVPTGDLPGAVGVGPALSLLSGLLIMRPGYHSLCCSWVRDAARGVHHAHLLGVVHRDLKPGNLMLGRDGRVRVIDFGLARCFDDPTLTASGQLLGSPLYMSPEQVTGRIELTERSDVYSLGLVLYELLTLSPPIPADNRQELFQRIITRPLDPLPGVNPAVSPALAAIVHKATAKDPADRYESAGALADDLDRVIGGQPVAAQAYRPPDRDDEVLGSRPTAVAALVVQLFTTTTIWVGYWSFMTAMPPTARATLADRAVLLPFMTGGEASDLAAFALGVVSAAAALWVAKGYRGGYRVGWAGLGLVTVSYLAVVDLLRTLAEIYGKAVWPRTLLGVAAVAQLGWLAVEYRRPRVRKWFDAARRARQPARTEGMFRGRPWGRFPIPVPPGEAGPTPDGRPG